MVPLNYGAPKAAARLADQAWHTAGTRPATAATRAAAVAARAYALNHRSEQARAALAAADTLMERPPESERSDTWLTFGEQKHHVHLSRAFTTLAETRRANESQQRALDLSAPPLGGGLSSGTPRSPALQSGGEGDAGGTSASPDRRRLHLLSE
jgi:hypothetical protein